MNQLSTIVLILGVGLCRLGIRPSIEVSSRSGIALSRTSKVGELRQKTLAFILLFDQLFIG